MLVFFSDHPSHHHIVIFLFLHGSRKQKIISVFQNGSAIGNDDKRALFLFFISKTAP
tara:strand:+ start:60 stop:230 length:171 start_codon:yes stop_codon:yes gene_type:complete